MDGYRDDPDVKAAHAWAVKHCWNSPLGHGTNPAPLNKCGTFLLGETMLDYLDNVRDEEKPFFTWLSFPDPHTPYQAPEPYASMIDPADVPMPPVDTLEGKPERVKVAHLMDAMDTADEVLIRQVRAIHYGMIRFIDDTLAKVFAKMDELGLTEHTIVIFTSDHGDSMGAHGIIQKHNFFTTRLTMYRLSCRLQGMRVRSARRIRSSSLTLCRRCSSWLVCRYRRDARDEALRHSCRKTLNIPP